MLLRAIHKVWWLQKLEMAGQVDDKVSSPSKIGCASEFLHVCMASAIAVALQNTLKVLDLTGILHGACAILCALPSTPSAIRLVSMVQDFAWLW
jgi:hypothetical protein